MIQWILELRKILRQLGTFAYALHIVSIVVSVSIFGRCFYALKLSRRMSSFWGEILVLAKILRGKVSWYLQLPFKMIVQK